MKIGEVSEQTGVSQRMIRHFESMGLFTAERIGSYRSYSNDHLMKIKQIKDLQDKGLSLKKIKVVIEDEVNALESSLIDAHYHNRQEIEKLQKQNLHIWECLENLKLSSSLEQLSKEGLVMEFVKSFEEKNVVRGRMPYLEILYETYVHLSGQQWEQAPMKILHSTDLIHIGEAIPEGKENDLKILISSEEQQFRNAFVFFLSPELLKIITGGEVIISELEKEKELNLKITKWVTQALTTFNHSWNATFSTLNLENHGMLESNEDIKKLYHDDEIFILTNMYTEDEKERFSIGLPYRFVSVIYNLLKR